MTMIAPIISDKRSIINVNINNKEVPMLVDTGSSLGIIDINKQKELGFKLTSKIPGTISGIGGESDSSAYNIKDCIVDIAGVKLYQFISTDISSVVESIKNSTGIEIYGIIGFTQIDMAEMKIDIDNKVIKIGY